MPAPMAEDPTTTASQQQVVDRAAEGATSSAPPAAPAQQQQGTGSAHKPVAIIVIGMAGSGKTTLIQRINSHLHTHRRPGYIINLDPAVTHVPYEANIDIRDTVKYKNVMKEYGLGPNGGILTSCNLFATRFDQVIKLCEKPRDPPLDFIVADTPGQIEIFTWSASGAIITELLASSFPTIVAYVIDTPRCESPQTFMSNMLQACSILYKTKLPMLLVFNKIDVTRHAFALEWMSDFESYHQALDKDSTYASTFSRSLSLVLDEFYANMKSVGVSAVTGEGMDEFFQGVASCAEDYQTYYVAEMEQLKKEKAEREARRQQHDLSKLQKDMAASKLEDPKPGLHRVAGGGGGAGAMGSGAAAAAAAAAEAGARMGVQGVGRRGGEEEEEEEEEEGEGEEGESCDYEVEDDEIEEEGGGRQMSM